MTVSVEIAGNRQLIEAEAERWRSGNLMERLWAKDATVWRDPVEPEIADRLGWLDLPQSSQALVKDISELAAIARSDQITDVVLCGMGGSSLAPEVFAAALEADADGPKLTVIDSTHPDAVAAVIDSTDPATTWYLISSKSGGTLETMSLFRTFWKSASQELEDPGSHFIAVTDEGSSLADLAADRGFRATIHADPDVGGRYSALTAFGLVPAGLIGADIGQLLAASAVAAEQCSPSIPLESNAAFAIGAILGAGVANGRDKAYFTADGFGRALPIWAEQLIAESTGKDNTGIVPIDGGPLSGDRSDAVVISIGSTSAPDADVHIDVPTFQDVAGAMFILELATAVAGEILAIQPFNQPDVQLAKILANQAMEDELDATGPKPMPIDSPQLADAISGAFATQPPSYVAIQAYLAPSNETDEALMKLRETIADRCDCLVSIGYGPRFLHSTGQLHKGGPPGGVYIQIIDTPTRILAVPETDYTFNELIAAQAAGDRAALADRDRSIIPVDLGEQGTEAIVELAKVVQRRSL